MVQRPLTNPFLIFVSLYAAILLGFLGVLNTEFFASQPNVLSVAMLADLLLTVPLIFWLLLRKTGLRPITVVPFWLIGFLFAGTAFPVSHNVILKLNRKCNAELLYGARRQFKIAVLHVDDPNRFAKAVSLKSLNRFS